MDEPPTWEFKSYIENTSYTRHDPDGRTRGFAKTQTWLLGVGGPAKNVSTWWYNDPTCIDTVFYGPDKRGVYHSTCPSPIEGLTRLWLGTKINANWSDPQGSDKYETHIKTMLVVHTKGRKLGTSGKRLVLFKIPWAVNQQQREGDELVGGDLIPNTALSILGQKPDCDGIIWRRLPIQTDIPFTVEATSKYKNYSFSVDVKRPALVDFKRAYHPMFANSPPRRDKTEENFNAGAVLLAEDNDKQVCMLPPNEDRDSPGSVYRSDDVPVYVEFEVKDGDPIIFPLIVSLPKYFDIRFDTDQSYLSAVGVADVTVGGLGGKVHIFHVNSMFFATLGKPAGWVLGAARWGEKMMVLTREGDEVTNVHEWGHENHLNHRGESDNIGPTTGAIMRDAWQLGSDKINRFEQSFLPRPPF